MKNTVKMWLYGSLIWVIGFAAGCAMWPIHSTHQLLFKSVMIVVMTFVGMIFIRLYFESVPSRYKREGIRIGLVWLFLNLALDLVVLVGLFKSGLREYLIGVGLRYLMIPILTTGVGIILDQKLGEKA
ncbi:MAG TPA: hypothetical protein ENN17_10090 [bacterium]|nr:hypothetical protein [bacterium]